MSNNNSYLQDLEKNPGQAYQNRLNDRENLTKRENKSNLDSKEKTPSADNPFNYNGNKDGKTSSKMKSKLKKRAVGVLIACLMGAGTVGIVGSLPYVLSGKIMDVVDKRYMAPTSKSIGTKTKKLLKCKMSVKCATTVNSKTSTGGDSEKGLGKISTKVKNLFKKKGSSISGPADGIDGKIKLKSGAVVGTGSDNTLSIEKTSPEISKELKDNTLALDDSYSSISGEPTANANKTSGANKEIPFSDDVGNDDDGKSRTIEQQLEDQKNKVSRENDLTSENGKIVSDEDSLDFLQSAKKVDDEDPDKSKPDTDTDPDKSKPDTDTDGDNSKAKTDTEIEAGYSKSKGGSLNVESGSSIFTRSRSKMNGLINKLSSSVGSKAVELIGGLACGVGSAAKGYTLAIRGIKFISLVRFGLSLASTMDSIKAADGSNREGYTGPTPEQFSQLMDSLTTVLKDKDGNIVTKSGTSSFGYHAAAGYLTPKSGSTFDITNVTDASTVGGPTDFTKSVMMNGSAGGGIVDIIMSTLSSMGIASGFACSIMLKIMDTVGIGAALAQGNALGAATEIFTLVSSSILSALDAPTLLTQAISVVAAVGSCAQQALSTTCIGAVFGTAIVIAMPLFKDYLIDGFASNFLIDPMPVGSDAMDSFVSGMSAYSGVNASGSGTPVVQSVTSNSSAFLELEQELIAYNKEQDAIKREGESPFDIYNTATFAGSIMGNFAAAIYANGNEPMQMFGSLLGMFGSSFANILNGTSVYADAASMAYAGSCIDNEIIESDIAADPFCNPIYGMLESDDMELDEVINAITDTSRFAPSAGAVSAIDETASGYEEMYGLDRKAEIVGVKNIKIGDFIDECVTRNKEGEFTLMGLKSEDDKQENGKNCAISDGSKYGRDNLVVLYNYIGYILANNNLNQGDQLGCQADGSCANGSSSSSSSEPDGPNGVTAKTDDTGDDIITQHAPTIANIPYGEYTVGGAGCGIISLITAAQALLGKKISVKDTLDWFNSSGLAPTYSDRGPSNVPIAQHLGLKAELMDLDQDQIKSVLKSGGMVQISGIGGGEFADGTTNPFTERGHYIVLRKLNDDGTVQIFDSAHAQGIKNSNTKYNLTYLMGSAHGQAVSLKK